MIIAQNGWNPTLWNLSTNPPILIISSYWIDFKIQRNFHNSFIFATKVFFLLRKLYCCVEKLQSFTCVATNWDQKTLATGEQAWEELGHAHGNLMLSFSYLQFLPSSASTQLKLRLRSALFSVSEKPPVKVAIWSSASIYSVLESWNLAQTLTIPTWLR